MDEGDLRLRRLTYRLFVELGRAPTAAETADAGALDEADVREGWQRLHEQHALVLDPTTAAIRMANPFSAVPTPYRVLAAIAGGMRTAPGTHSGSAPRSTSTA